MYRYTLYGLCLQSNRPLPGLAPANAGQGVDWEIQINGTGGMPNGWHSGAWDNSLMDATNKVLLMTSSGDVGIATHWFRVDNGNNALDIRTDSEQRQIWICWQHDQPESLILETVSDALNQIVLTYLLRLQGRYVLHGAALVAEQRSFLLIATSGTGKSTLTLALAAAGVGVLTEETAVLERKMRSAETHSDARRVLVAQPGMTRLRLWPTTLAAMGIVQEGLALVPTNGEKRYLPLTLTEQHQSRVPSLHYATEPAQVACIYWLAAREAALVRPQFTPMSPGAATTMLLQNRYHPFPVGQTQVAQEFRQAVEMASTIPVRCIQLPDCLDQLEQTAAYVLEDFQQMLQTSA